MSTAAIGALAFGSLFVAGVIASFLPQRIELSGFDNRTGEWKRWRKAIAKRPGCHQERRSGWREWVGSGVRAIVAQKRREARS